MYNFYSYALGVCSVYMEQDLIFKLSIDVPEIEKKVPQPKPPSVKVWRLKLNPHPENIPKYFYLMLNRDQSYS